MIEVWFHGSCEPINPGGSMACSFIAKMDGADRKRYTEFWAPHDWSNAAQGSKVETSANVAAYQAIVNALGYLYASQLHLEETIIRGNSKMVMNQMFGGWKINDGYYAPLALACQDILKHWQKIRGELIPWAQNAEVAGMTRETFLKNGVTPTDWSKKGELNDYKRRGHHPARN